MNARRQILSVVLAAAVAVSVAGGAAAQPAAKSTPGAAEKQPEKPAAVVAPQPSDAPFMRPLARLATVLGSVSFLRQLCGDANAPAIRAKMDDLIRLQSPGAADKEILVASYNSGYRSFAAVYRRCTPAARVAAARYQNEGAVLSRDIAAKHGN